MTKSREIRQKILKIMDLALKISPPDVEDEIAQKCADWLNSRKGKQ